MNLFNDFFSISNGFNHFSNGFNHSKMETFFDFLQNVKVTDHCIRALGDAYASANRSVKNEQNNFSKCMAN